MNIIKQFYNKWIKQKIPEFIADHLPKKIVYFCAIRVWAYATTGKWSNTIAPDITVDEALQRWNQKN